MSSTPSCTATETYTPCFDWVVQATGCQATALTYGLVWRYAQMGAHQCYASCERLAGHLAWSRQSIMRHLQRLLRLGLIVCSNPHEVGVTRRYRPVSRETWAASHMNTTRGQDAARSSPQTTRGSHPAPAPAQSRPPAGRPVAPDGATLPDRAAPPPVPAACRPTAPCTRCDLETAQPGGVPSCDTPCDTMVQGPVTSADTRNTSRSTNKRQEGAPGAASEPAALPDAGRRAPGIQMLKQVTGRFPPAVLQGEALAALGAQPDRERLDRCYRAWCARGYNPCNYAWLIEWYAGGGVPARPARKTRAAPRPPAGTVADTDLVASFSRWSSFQQAIQRGEHPDDVRNRLQL